MSNRRSYVLLAIAESLLPLQNLEKTLSGHNPNSQLYGCISAWILTRADNYGDGLCWSVFYGNSFCSTGTWFIDTDNTGDNSQCSILSKHLGLVAVECWEINHEGPACFHFVRSPQVHVDEYFDIRDVDAETTAEYTLPEHFGEWVLLNTGGNSI